MRTGPCKGNMCARQPGGSGKMRFILSIIATLTLAACNPNATINDAIVSSGVAGAADDAGGDQQNYPGKMPLSATDGNTNAASIQPKYNELSGSAHAIPVALAAAKRDEAFALSNNFVQTKFTVTQADSFTFSISINFQAPIVTGKGKLEIRVSAYVLDSKGQPATDTKGNAIPPIFDGTFGAGVNAQGKVSVIDPKGVPDALDAKGNYERSLKGPNKGISLTPGDFQLKLELRIDARAPPGQGTAGVDSATATIELL